MKSGVTIIIDKRDFKIFFFFLKFKKKRSKKGVKFTHTYIYIQSTKKMHNFRYNFHVVNCDY